MHKRVWIAAGDIILVGFRIYQDDKADVILINTPDEARRLKNIGELPDGTRLNEGLLLILMMTPMLVLLIILLSFRMRILIRSKF